MKNRESELTLISYREVILIFWHERIIGVFKGGINFITKASFLMKQEAIYELQKHRYLSEELADFLLNKLCYCDVKKANVIGNGRTGYLHIHLEKYNDKVLVFQNNNLDLMDENGYMEKKV